jgi:hypothetical protein
MSSPTASDKPPDKPSHPSRDATVEDRPAAAAVTFPTIEFRDGTPVSLAINGRTYHGHVDSVNGQFVVDFGAAGVSDEQ